MRFFRCAVPAVLLFVFSISGQQQSLSPEMLLQLQKAKEKEGISVNMNRFLRNEDIRDSLKFLSDSLGDSLDTLQDSTNAAMRYRDTVKPELSIYERMFRGEDILPDSLLSELKVYGYDVFNRKGNRALDPSQMNGVPANYPVRAGDEINVDLWGRINENYQLKVSRDGTITIPRVGPIPVAGQRFRTMKASIQQKVESIEGVNVSVSMGEIKPIGIYVVGEVKSPGFHTVNALTNVTNALFASGGITKNGSLRNIQLMRNGKLVSQIDFYDFLLSGKDRTGLRLQSGDVLLVPIAKKMVAVAGNVRRSALYELKEPTKLSEVLELAGGVSPSAWTNRIQVERFLKNQYQVVLDVDSSKMSLPDFQIQDGDVVKVFPVLDKEKNAVYLSGNVLRPGKYEFKEGMRIRDVIPDHQELLPECYFDYAVVLRKSPPSYLERIVPFNLHKALKSEDLKDNLKLQEQDEIIIYHKDYFRPNRSVNIDGAVTTPGKYKLLDNMTVRDLILQAGGLSDEASPRRGELYRRQIENEQVKTRKIAFGTEKAMNDDPTHNMVLKRGDRVYIRNKKGWETERKVTLSGQFVYPGTYVIFEDETLGDLIKRAGGFKPDAHLSAAVFTRKSVKVQEEKHIADYTRQLELDILKLSAEVTAKNDMDASEMLEQQMRLKEKLSSAEAKGRVVIDMTDEESYGDFALENDDELHVPRNLNTISVLGEVFNPATFRYKRSNPVATHYIDIAGGLKENADKDLMYVIRANGSIVTNKTTPISSIRLEPGDAVVVPAKLRHTNPHKLFVDTADAAFKITGFISALVTLIIAINKL
ncbi:MAG: SLBB domain-containing protein [Chitinispirillaceae bacterium]